MKKVYATDRSSKVSIIHASKDDFTSVTTTLVIVEPDRKDGVLDKSLINHVVKRRDDVFYCNTIKYVD